MPPALQNPMTLWLLLTAALAGLAYAFMRPELRVKAIAYGAFLLACAVAVWPPYEQGGTPGKIHLGLDLRGGIHLVLQVVVDDALNATVDDAVATTRDQATRKGIQIGPVQRVSPQSFSVSGTEPARVKDMRDLLSDFFRGGWEVRESGEGGFSVEMTDLYQRQLKDQTVQEVIRTDGVKLRLGPSHWLMLRFSGTEPLLRLYCEAPGEERVAEVLAWARQLADGI